MHTHTRTRTHTRTHARAVLVPQVLVTLDERANLRLHDPLSLNELQAISVKSYAIVSQVRPSPRPGAPAPARARTYAYGSRRVGSENG